MSRRSSLECHRWEINVENPAWRAWLSPIDGRGGMVVVLGVRGWLEVWRGGSLIWWMTRSSGSNTLRRLQHNTRVHPTRPTTMLDRVKGRWGSAGWHCPPLIYTLVIDGKQEEHICTHFQIQILIITYSTENMMVSKFMYTVTLACHISKCFTFDTIDGWHLGIFMMPWGNSFVHISNKYILHRLFTLITPELMCLLYPVLLELCSELTISRLTGHRGCDPPSYPLLLWYADLFFKARCCDCTPSSSQQVVLNSVKLTSTNNGSKYCAILVIFKAMLNYQEGHYRITSDAVP